MPAEAVHRRILSAAAAAGFSDLVPAHLAVLRYPGPDGRRPSELAADAGISRQAMNYLLGELERLGYLKRTNDPETPRSKLIQLTARGSALSVTIRQAVGTIEQELADELGTAHYEQLRQLLVRLNETSLVQRRPSDLAWRTAGA